jgi:uncharacterized protein DUF6933
VDGFESIFREYIEPEVDTIVVAKVLNRSVTGSMTDMIKLSEFMLIEEGKSLAQAAARLNQTPFGALNYDYPRERFTALIS